MIVEDFKKSIINSAISGMLTKQDITCTVDSKFNDYRDELVFFIPENWKCVKLSEVSDYGKNISISGKNITGEEWILELEDIEKDSGILLKKVYQKERKAVSNKNKFSKGNVLYGKLRPYLNKCIIADDDGYCSTEIVSMNLDKNIINKYLQLVLMSPYYLNYVNEKSYGTKMPRLGTKDAQNSLIPLPPLEEQQRIVDKINELFSILDEIKPIETELISMKTNLPKELNKSIIDYAIHGYLSNQLQSDSDVLSLIPDRSTCLENYHKFNLELNENEYPFSIPENWKWVKLGMFFNYQNGYAYKPSETSKNGIGIPVIKSQNIMKRVVEINNKTVFVENPTEQMLKSKIIKGDFLMCLSSQSNNPEPLGKTAIYNGDDYALLNQRVLKLTPINTNLSKYMYYVINSFYFHNTVSHKGGGSAQSNLKLEHVMEMYIPLPPIEEQQRIVNKLEQLLPLCEDIDKLLV